MENQNTNEKIVSIYFVDVSKSYQTATPPYHSFVNRFTVTSMSCLFLYPVSSDSRTVILYNIKYIYIVDYQQIPAEAAHNLLGFGLVPAIGADCVLTAIKPH